MSTEASQLISLPTGGGALSGLGETFSPNVQSGTGGMSIPLALPAGRNGFQPSLKLVYSTGNGSGVFGFGWSLGMPAVSRKTSKALPLYGATDVFVVPGGEDLVAVAQAADHAVYRPRTEGAFSRIEHYNTASGNFWRIVTRDGVTNTFGTPRPTGAGPNWTDPAVLYAPGQPGKIAAWQLSESHDTFGNGFFCDYEHEFGPSDRPWHQVYLRRVRYADYTAAGVVISLYTVEFTYTGRPDPSSEYRFGFEVRTTKRCSHIDVMANTGSGNKPVRSYALTYQDETGTPPMNRASLLARCQLTGRDGTNNEALPPLHVGYTAFSPSERTFTTLSGAGLPTASLSDANYAMVDLFGTGLPDVLATDTEVRYWRNRGDGQFDLPRSMPLAPAGISLAAPGVQLLDANGDGAMDLLVTTPGLAGYYPMRFDGGWDRRSFQRYRQAPSFELKDPSVSLVDLTGDGVADAIRSGSFLEVFFNDPQLGWTSTRRLDRATFAGLPNVDLSDPRMRWADMTGDGLEDLLFVGNGAVTYWPNLGYGRWGGPVHMKTSPRFPSGYNPVHVLLGDVDGDGVTDLVYVDDRRVTLWINQAGNQWSDPVVIQGTPPVSDGDSVQLVDLLGSGVAGVLWSAAKTAHARSNLFFLDFTGGVKPYLMDEIDNQIGARTRIEYAPSTQFYLQDYPDPTTRWCTPLPFPVQVVAKVTVTDALSGGRLTTAYRYHHGYWDGVDREFRGFGMVEQVDTEVFETYAASTGGNKGVCREQFSPPTCLKTWFHLGPVSDGSGSWTQLDYGGEFWSGDRGCLAAQGAGITTFLKTLATPALRRNALRTLRGSALRTELYAEDGSARATRPYSVTEIAYGLRQEKALTAEPGVFFPHIVAQRTTQWERGEDPMTQFAFSDSADYDAFGQQLRSTSIACPRDWHALDDKLPAPYLATRTRTAYAVPSPASAWMVNRVCRVTQFELTNTGSVTVAALHTLADDDPSLRIFAQSLTYFDGPAFAGLPLGQLGAFGAPTRTETLSLTEAILEAAYRSGAAVLSPPELPPYLQTQDAVGWTAEYPAEFKAAMPGLAGYVYHAAGSGPEECAGFFIESVRNSYDFQQASAGGVGQGLVLVRRGTLGFDTTWTYDSYNLLPVRVTDPAGLVTSAVYDYRTQQPLEVTDQNGMITSFVFSPLGLVEATFVKGAFGEGDQTLPGTTWIYDFSAFRNSPATARQPISVTQVQRCHHDTETDVQEPERSQTITSCTYSDGFGRAIQSRLQVEDLLFGNALFGEGVVPASQGDVAGTTAPVTGRQRGTAEPPNTIVSGWTVYDNKGRPVETYQPFFSQGYGFAAPTGEQWGYKTTTFYDPRGRIVRSLQPDGSEQNYVYGVPGRIAAPDISDPERFEPTPWETYFYDANDNAGRTDAAGSAAYSEQWNTPSNTLCDARQRVVQTVKRNCMRTATGEPGPVQEIQTTSTYDINDNLVAQVDGLGRTAFEYGYDLLQRAWRVMSIDAGLSRIVIDASGQEVERRDGKGALQLATCDALGRKTHMWARDSGAEAVTLRERSVFGDDPTAGLTAQQTSAGYLLGRMYLAYDEAGRIAIGAYDFKGNLLDKIRQTISAANVLSVFAGPPASWAVAAFRVDWAPSGASDPASLATRASILLDTATYQTTLTCDALNRVKTKLLPQDVTGRRSSLLPHYNQAGALDQLSLDGNSFLNFIAYDAQGRRSLVAYGNGILSRYAYDPRTTRILRLRSEPCTQLSAAVYAPGGAVLQDFSYSYDLSGNMLLLLDRTPGSGIVNTVAGEDALDRTFRYDALYRLLSANGRECALAPDLPWDDSPRPTDLSLTRAYAETYGYDAADNLLSLSHTANQIYAMAPGSNRLATMTVGQTVYNYAYDDSGNLLSENTSRHFDWDHANRMRSYRTQAGTSEPSLFAQYLYDSSGQRVMKVLRMQGGSSAITVSIDGSFEWQSESGNGVVNNTVHVADPEGRVATVRVGPAFPDDATPAVKYVLADHLGSSNVVLGGADALGAAPVNREEYTPYGGTSFGSYARKRYRFTGQERDDESGLSYHGARYYAPWLARWASTDPAGPRDGPNLLHYTSNPITRSDPSGTDPSGGEIQLDTSSSSLPPGTIIIEPSQVTFATPPAATIPAAAAVPAAGAASPMIQDMQNLPWSDFAQKYGLPVGDEVTPEISGEPMEAPGLPTDIMSDPSPWPYTYQAPPAIAPVAAIAPGAAIPAAAEAPAWLSVLGVVGSVLASIFVVAVLALTVSGQSNPKPPKPTALAAAPSGPDKTSASYYRPNDHHVTPREFWKEFDLIGIDFNDYTITIPE